MTIESYSVRCSDCNGRGYVDYKICRVCDGNGQYLVTDADRQQVRDALDGFVRASQSLRATLQSWGVLR